MLNRVRVNTLTMNEEVVPPRDTANLVSAHIHDVSQLRNAFHDLEKQYSRNKAEYVPVRSV
jgi:hypothetical protein